MVGRRSAFDGYQALGDPEHAHHLTIAFSRHLLASDLGRFENRFTWFERTYAKSHASAFEEKSYDRAGWKKVLQDLRSRDTWPPGLASSTEFTGRLMRSSLRHKHVREFSYDVEKTDKPIDKLLLEMLDEKAASPRWQEMHYAVRHTLQFAAIALREWYIPGKYMHELLKLDLPDSPRVLLTIGAAHEDLERKFNTFGMTPKVRRLVRDKKRVETYRQALRDARINFQELGSLSLSN